MQIQNQNCKYDMYVSFPMCLARKYNETYRNQKGTSTWHENRIDYYPCYAFVRIISIPIALASKKNKNDPQGQSNMHPKGN